MSPQSGAPRAVSLYVHVPFCVVKCGYCDFTSYVVEDEAEHDRFLAALARELDLAGAPTAPSSVFIGGGTPSHLRPDRLQALLAAIGQRCTLRDVEVTMEMNPESVTVEKASIALAGGVNRFSMGVQSFAPERLHFLDRAHSGERARQAFAELRTAGAMNLSIDLIFGIPGQTLAEWEQDLAIALELRPDHLSCYNLTFEPGTRLYRDLQRGRVRGNDEEVDRSMFVRTRELLSGAGYRAYEISNFAGRGGPCRHNDHYWLQGDYVGVGPGASSHRSGHRTTNLKALDAWAQSALAGIPPAATAEVLTPMQRIGEALWLGVRRHEGVDLAAVERRIGFRLPAETEATIAQHVARGWVSLADRCLALTDAGLFVADAVGRDYLVVDGEA